VLRAYDRELKVGEVEDQTFETWLAEHRLS
jgi:hypothetical protein